MWRKKFFTQKNLYVRTYLRKKLPRKTGFFTKRFHRHEVIIQDIGFYGCNDVRICEHQDLLMHWSIDIMMLTLIQEILIGTYEANTLIHNKSKLFDQSQYWASSTDSSSGEMCKANIFKKVMKINKNNITVLPRRK